MGLRFNPLNPVPFFIIRGDEDICEDDAILSQNHSRRSFLVGALARLESPQVKRSKIEFDPNKRLTLRIAELN